MRIPEPYLPFGDEDEMHTEVVPERRLFLAVFIRAVLDLSSDQRRVREQAIEWFQGAPAQVTFMQVNELFDFKADRLCKLREYMQGGATHKFRRHTIGTQD